MDNYKDVITPMKDRKWHRVPLPEQVRTAAILTGEPGMRAWQCDLNDGHLTVLVAKCATPEFDAPRWHLSISHCTSEGKPGRYPDWDEITEARYRFVPDDVIMAMLLPPRAEYVNVHETTFHLWEIAR